MIGKKEIGKRISTMQEMLKGQALDGALFIFPIDVYYFSGTRQNATLWLQCGIKNLFADSYKTTCRLEA